MIPTALLKFKDSKANLLIHRIILIFAPVCSLSYRLPLDFVLFAEILGKGVCGQFQSGDFE